MRIADKSDIDQLYGIYSHESVSPFMGFDPCSRKEFEELFPELLEGGELCVLEEGKEIIAVCKIVRRKHRLKHSAYIGSLAVKHTHQNQGVGNQFFSDALSLLKSEGLKRVELLVAADNDVAIKFFKRFGFVVEGTHNNYFSRAGSSELFAEHTMAWLQ